MSDINGDSLRGLSDAIKGIKDGGDKLTLTTGTVVSSTASETWVQVESGQRFPAGSSTVDAAQGDTVNVTIQKGTATITGNSSQKATNANYVDSAVEPVREAAEQAAKAASEATISAGQAKEQAAAATEAATEAKEKSQAAADAATAAATSASNAATSAKTAESKATAAATSASNAESSAASAKTSASNAATDAATAKTQATNAATSASNAETSASAAQTSAKNAESSASAAQTQATNAASSASAAQTSASAAQTSAKNAESSASAAKTSASNAQSSASAAATSASAAASDAATAKSQASAATEAATEAKTQAASAVTSATEAKTQAAAAKTAADQATTDAATAGIAASRAQTAAQAAEKAIGIEPDDTKTEDELVSQAWFWTDGGGAHIVAGRKDGTPTSSTQTDINDKGLSVVSLEDYSTLASFGVDSDGKAISRLGQTTGSYTEVTNSGLDTYMMQGEIIEITVSEAESLSSDKILTFGENLISGSSRYAISEGVGTFSFKVNGLEDANNQKPAIAVKVSDYIPTVAAAGFTYLTGYRISGGGGGASGAPMDVRLAIVSEIPSDGQLFDSAGNLRNVIDETEWIYKDTWRGNAPKDCYFVCYYNSWGSKTEPTYPLSAYFVTVSKKGYISAQTKHHAASIGLDSNGLIRAKIGDEGYVQIDDMQMDIYRAEADVSTSEITTFSLSSGSQAVVETGWTSAVSSRTTLSFAVPSGFAGSAYSVFQLTDVWDVVNTSTRKLDINLNATAWASDSSISYLEFYIIDKPYLYDDSGEMVDYLYYSGQELPLSVTTDEMQWAKIQNLYIAFNLGTVPDTLPATVSVSTKTVTAYLYTPTGEATLQSHFGRKTELSYTEGTDYRTPMFSLDPDAGFKIVSPDANGWDTPGASITGDTGGLWLGSSGTISAYAPKINLETGPVLSTERISNRSNYGGSGGLVLDHLSANGDAGLMIARNGSLVQGFIQSEAGNRGVWDNTQHEWYYFRPSGSKDTYINGLASSFQYKSYSIYTGRSIGGGSYTNGTTNISNSGYKPFAIAGWHTSTRWHNCNRAYLSAINNGSGTITWMVNNWNSSAKSGDLTLYVLWIRY